MPVWEDPAHKDSSQSSINGTGDASSFLMRPKFDITFPMNTDPRFESSPSTTNFCQNEDSEAETEFYVKEIENATPTVFGTTLDLVWPSPENVPDAIEPVLRN